MLSISTISAGGGWKYLQRQVVTDHENYYLRGAGELGEQPGYWMGSALDTLGLAGEVTAEQMEALFDRTVSPATGEPLGRAHRQFRNVTDRLAEALARHDQRAAKEWEATLGRLVARGAGAEEIAVAGRAHEGLVAEQWKETSSRIRKTGQRHAVAGYDLTFSPPKSWSVLWASAPDAAKEVIWRCHWEGAAAALRYVETHAAYTRRGYNGVRHEKVAGVVAAAFDHRTSRAGDPNIHTHMAVLARVQAADGTWLTLDGQELFHARAAGAVGEQVADAALARELGVAFEVDPATGVREIVGVDKSLRTMFSSRRAQIAEGLAPMVSAYMAAHGREPTPWIKARMSQFATLDTRPVKGPHQSPIDLLARWERQVRAETGKGLAKKVWRQATGQKHISHDVPLTDEDVVTHAIAQLTADKATWTRNDATRAVATLVPTDPANDQATIFERVDRLTDAVLEAAVALTPPLLADSPVSLTADGHSVYDRPNARRFTTQAAWVQEQSLLALARHGHAHSVDGELSGRVLATHNLSVDQRAAASGVLTDGRAVSSIVGPPGTGKTTVVAAIEEAWRAGGNTVLGLSLSQNAAQVLGAAANLRAENTAKLLTETARLDPARFPHHAERWGIARDTLVVLDEAGMADRATVAAIGELCRVAGAKLVLVGDPSQIDSPGAGGTMRLVVGATGAATYQLGSVWRFDAAWERAASVRLRLGDISVLDLYDDHARIFGGTEEQMESLAVHNAISDHLGGKSVFLLAGTNDQASRLAGAFRSHLVSLGLVTAGGVELRDGNRAGIGDRVVTRKNDRGVLTTDGTFVANRDTFEVLAFDHGRPLVARVDPTTGIADQQNTTTLPSWYLATQMELAYAGTVHAGQGGTRHAGHALVDPRMDAGQLNVAMTRGRSTNTAYVTSVTQPDVDQEPHTTDPLAVLAGIMERADHPEGIAATDTLAAEVERIGSLHTLVPILADLVATHHTASWRQAIAASATNELAEAITAAPAWPSLAALLRNHELAGMDVASELNTAIRQRGFGAAFDPAAVLYWRLDGALGDQTVPAHGSFASQVPDGSSDGLELARVVAAQIDARGAVLAERVAVDQPPWASTLGPVPDDPLERFIWLDRIAVIAGYREAFFYTGDDPLGPQPTASRTEALAWWTVGEQALAPGEPAEVLSVEELRVRVIEGDRAMASGPEAVIDLRAAALAAREAMASADRAGFEVQRLLDGGGSPDPMAAASVAYTSAREQMSCAVEHLAAREHAAEVRAAWRQETQPVLAWATSARHELAARHQDAGEGDVSVPVPATEHAVEAVEVAADSTFGDLTIEELHARAAEAQAAIGQTEKRVAITASAMARTQGVFDTAPAPIRAVLAPDLARTRESIVKAEASLASSRSTYARLAGELASRGVDGVAVSAGRQPVEETIATEVDPTAPDFDLGVEMGTQAQPGPELAL